MNEDKLEDFNIPEMAYKIPIEKFFSWYNAKLTYIWNNMTLEEKKEYFKDMEKKDFEKIDMQIKIKMNSNKIKASFVC